VIVVVVGGPVTVVDVVKVVVEEVINSGVDELDVELVSVVWVVLCADVVAVLDEVSTVEVESEVAAVELEVVVLISVVSVVLATVVVVLAEAVVVESSGGLDIADEVLVTSVLSELVEADWVVCELDVLGSVLWEDVVSLGVLVLDDSVPVLEVLVVEIIVVVNKLVVLDDGEEEDSPVTLWVDGDVISVELVLVSVVRGGGAPGACG